jgi:putative transposase
MRVLADFLVSAYGVNIRRVYRALRFNLSTYLYHQLRPDKMPLRMRLRELATARARHGYPRLHGLLRREGWMVNTGCLPALVRDARANTG